MMLQRWDPFMELRRIHNRQYRPSPVFSPPINTAINGADGREWSIALDIVQEDDRYVVRASLPGIAPENIEVSVDHDVLTIKGRAEAEAEDQREDGNYMGRERRSGSFMRSLRLPESLDAENVEAGYEHGVLTITLPKREETKAKRIEVKVA